MPGSPALALSMPPCSRPAALAGHLVWLTDAGEAVGVFGRVLQPFRGLAVTLAGNWPLILIIAGAALFLAGRRVFRDELESFRKGEWS